MIRAESSIQMNDNQRACMRIVGAIAQYPQSLTGSYFIAKQALSEDYPLTLPLLGQVDPDGKHIADHVNRIHEAFGVGYEVTPDEAEVTVVRLAMTSLETVRQLTLLATRSMHPTTNIPKQLHRDVRRPGYKSFIREGIWQRPVLALHNFLEDHSDVHETVLDVVRHVSTQVRADAPRHRRTVLAKYDMHREFGFFSAGFVYQRSAASAKLHADINKESWRRAIERGILDTPQQ